MPPSSQPPESSGLVPIETDRWRITPNGDDTFTLRPLTSFDGPAAPANTLLLTAEDVVDLANLLSIGSDLLNGTVSVDVFRLRFVEGFRPDARVLFSALGHPPPHGAEVTLPDHGLVFVMKTSWSYGRHGAATVTVHVQRAAASRGDLRQEEHES